MRALNWGVVGAAVFAVGIVVAALTVDDSGVRGGLLALLGLLAIASVLVGALLDRARRRRDEAPPPRKSLEESALSESRMGGLDVTRVGSFTARRR